LLLGNQKAKELKFSRIIRWLEHIDKWEEMMRNGSIKLV
jgi:hypothetical protein